MAPGAKVPASTMIANSGSLHSVVQAPSMPPSAVCVVQGPHFSLGPFSAKGIEAQGLNNLLETHGQIPGN